MTCDELKAAINDEIAQNARIAAIRKRMDAGDADFLDSELYTAITAEITAEQMQRNVLVLSDREPAFVGVVRERYTDTFNVFNAVQRILDAVTGIRIRTVQPGFENDRAHKIGHSLNDPTVPESVIERRAYSATENFVRSQHDRCTKANASFRSRAGLDCRITRTGGAKCCDWCASVSGSFTTSSAPDGIWGRHDNCKCSITYETRRGSFQQLSGSGKGWDTVEELPDIPLHVLDGSLTGAGEVHAVSAEEAAGTAKKMGLHVLTNENERVRIEEREREFGFQYGERAINADMDYIYSREYESIFQHITESPTVNSALLECARTSIDHRNGTKYEDMYFIHAETGEILASQTEMEIPSGVSYNDEIKKLLKRAETEHIPLISLHNHPEGYPPSVDDLNKSFENGTIFGLAVGHNGQVYKYNNPGHITDDADDIHFAIALLCQDGSDPDRIYTEEYKRYGLSYEILKGA